MTKTSIKKYYLFFILGGTGYSLIEILWRGYTHYSMVLAGGLCFIFFSIISTNLKSKPLFLKAIICSLIITIIELFFGIIFNLIFKMNVWNYANLPFNILGQICPLYTLIWFVLSFIFLPLAHIINSYLYAN